MLLRASKRKINPYIFLDGGLPNRGGGGGGLTFGKNSQKIPYFFSERLPNIEKMEKMENINQMTLFMIQSTLYVTQSTLFYGFHVDS